MCTGLSALFASLGAAGTGTSAAAAGTTAAGIASGAITPTVVGSGLAGTATSTGLATGAALAPATSTAASTGLAAGAAKTLGALLPGAVTPLLLKPKVPTPPAIAVSDPVNSAAKARMAARLKAQGAYTKSSTNLTGGAVAGPTSGQKLTLGA